MRVVTKTIHALQMLGFRRFVRFTWKSLLQRNPAHIWEKSEPFRTRFCEIRAHTLVDCRRAFILHQLCQQALNLEGDFAEVGVFRGGTARLLASVIDTSGKALHLFDTFEGMPRTDAKRDFCEEGDFADTSLDGVKLLLKGLNCPVLHPGFFPATAESLRESRFAFVHIDVDIHQSVMDCCQFFYPRLVPGGIMVFDDYGFLTCEGAREAVDEHFCDKPEVPIYLPTGQALVIKIGERGKGELIGPTE